MGTTSGNGATSRSHRDDQEEEEEEEEEEEGEEGGGGGGGKKGLGRKTGAKSTAAAKSPTSTTHRDIARPWSYRPNRWCETLR